MEQATAFEIKRYLTTSVQRELTDEKPSNKDKPTHRDSQLSHACDRVLQAANQTKSQSDDMELSFSISSRAFRIISAFAASTAAESFRFTPLSVSAAGIGSPLRHAIT